MLEKKESRVSPTSLSFEMIKLLSANVLRSIETICLKEKALQLSKIFCSFSDFFS